MILLFDLFVLCLLIAVVVHVFAGYRERRLRSPVAVPYEDLVPYPPSLNGQPKTTKQRIVGLSAKILDAGVHLEFYLPPNRRGITSAITSLISTRQHDERGAVYQMTTASGSKFLVSMCDDTAKRVLSTYYAWKNKRKHSPARGPIRG
jgi:hypothetical protein